MSAKSVNSISTSVVSLLQNFAERVLSQIQDNRGKLLRRHREETYNKKNELLKGEAFDVACSILNMSTSDLEDFLKDEHLKFDVRF